MIDKAYRREKYLVKCKITPHDWDGNVYIKHCGT